MDLKKIFTIKNIINFINVNIGSVLIACGIHYFILPAKLTGGGLAGFSIIMGTLTGFSMQSILFVCNIILTILGIFAIGMSFGIFTIYSSFSIPIFIGILEKISPINNPLSDDLLVVLIFGTLISAVGITMTLNSGASSGGTDIISKIIEKYTPLSFGQAMMLCDGLVTLGACYIYGAKIGMYALLSVFINSFAIDNMLSGFNSKYNVTIISEKLYVINKFILEELHRGSTIYSAQGGFSQKEKKILCTIVNRKQYIRVHNFVKKTDSNAFLFVNQVHEIEGEGFTYNSINNN